MKSRYVFGLAASLWLTSHLAAAALHGNKGFAIFKAVGPAGMEIQGKTSDITVSETNQDVLVKVALARLDTGISLRNRHMREKYLEVAKYPNAELVVKRSDLKFPEAGKEVQSAADGELKIHGKSRKVHFNYRAKNTSGGIDVTGSTRIDIRDYGIVVPSYLGITVKPNVDISVQFAAEDT